MSHFSTILKNLVASGMTNTNAALVVLESFFEENDQDSSNRAVQYRGNIADTADKVATGIISEQEAQLAFSKVKAHTLDLIEKVSDVQFDDAIVINYFAMLTPNPAKDPFFSPIAPEEQAAEAVATQRPTATASSKSDTESPKSRTESEGSSWLWIIGGIGLFLVIGLIYLIVAFGECTISSQPSRLAATSQAPVLAEPTDVKPTDVNKTATTPTTQPATATGSSITSRAKTSATPTAKPLPEKPKIPEIVVKSSRDREKVERVVRDSLTPFNNTLNLKVAELKKSNLLLIELTKLAEKDASQAAKKDEEKKKFTTLTEEIRVLRSEIKRLTESLPK